VRGAPRRWLAGGLEAKTRGDGSRPRPFPEVPRPLLMTAHREGTVPPRSRPRLAGGRHGLPTSRPWAGRPVEGPVDGDPGQTINDESSPLWRDLTWTLGGDRLMMRRPGGGSTGCERSLGKAREKWAKAGRDAVAMAEVWHGGTE
jgi:hypothetical protein